MDKVSYAIGMSMANNLVGAGINNLNFEDYCAGVKDFLDDKSKLTLDECNAVLAEYFNNKKKADADAASKAGKEYLEANAMREGVVVLPSGLQYRVLKEGTGKKPSSTSQVDCHYEGRLIDGTKFDSSYDRGQTAKFGLNQVIPGWTEGLQLMSEGSKYELTIPSELGYGANGVPGVIPPYSVLVFTVELVKVL